MALEIFKLVGSVFVDNSAANESLGKTDEKAQSVGTSLLNGVGTAAKWAAGITAAGVAGVTALVGVATKSADAMDVIDKGSQKMGISTKAYQEWDYAMGQSGMSIDTMKNGMKTLSNLMDGAVTGTASAQETFNKLGVSLYDSSGAMKSQEQTMSESIMALSNMAEGADRTALAVDLFGKSGTELAPLLNEGADGVQALIDRSHELGLVVSDDAVDAGVKLGDTMDDVKQSFGMIGTQLGTAVMPIVQQFADMIIDNLPMIQGAVEQLAPVFMTLISSLLPPLMQLAQSIFPVLMDLIQTLIPVITNIAMTILPIFCELLEMLLPPLVQIIQMLLPPLVEIINALLPLLQPILQLLEPIITLVMALLEPLIQLIGMILPPLVEMLSGFIALALDVLNPTLEAIASIITYVLNEAFREIMPIIEVIMAGMQLYWSAIYTVISTVVTNIKNTVTTIFTTIKTTIITIISAVQTEVAVILASVKSVFSDTFNSLVGIVKAPLNAILGFVNKVIDALNTIQVDIPEWVPGWGGKTFGFNFAQIPMLAKGGDIEQAGSAIVGEAGAELVDLPSGTKVTPLSGNTIEDKIAGIMGLLETLNNNMAGYVSDGMSGTEVSWNDRELGRMVKTYA